MCEPDQGIIGVAAALFPSPRRRAAACCDRVEVSSTAHLPLPTLRRGEEAAAFRFAAHPRGLHLRPTWP